MTSSCWNDLRFSPTAPHGCPLSIPQQELRRRGCPSVRNYFSPFRFQSGYEFCEAGHFPARFTLVNGNAAFGPDVGRWPDLGIPGTRIVPPWGKNIPAIFPGHSRRNSTLKVCGIERYDDLLLPRHRLLAQLPVFASGEHFENIFIVILPKRRVRVL